MEGTFHEKLKYKIHNFVMLAYDISKAFPKEEKYGSTSQFRRATLSIMLNYVEGYARRRDKVKLNFYEISHGSAQESKYLLYFALCQNWILKEKYKELIKKGNEISKMLWSTIDILEKKVNN